MAVLEGIDYDDDKGVVDAAAVAAAGRGFACPKFTEGVGYKDGRGDDNRANAVAAFDGRVAPYHWCRPDNGRGFSLGDSRSAVLEADWYLSQIGTFGDRERPMLDFEEPTGSRNDATL